MLKLRDEALAAAGYELVYDTTAGMALDGATCQKGLMTVHVATNPDPAETIGVGGKTYTFVASGAGVDEINIGSGIAETVVNIIDKLNLDSYLAGADGVQAFYLGDTSKFVIVENVIDAEPAFVDDGVKVVEDIAWSKDIALAQLTDLNYFKFDPTGAGQGNTLSVHHYDGDGVSGYSGALPYQNFLY